MLLRALAAALALVTIPVGVVAGLDAQLAVVAAVLVLPLIMESRLRRESGRRPADPEPSRPKPSAADAAG